MNEILDDAVQFNILFQSTLRQIECTNFNLTEFKDQMIEDVCVDSIDTLFYTSVSQVLQFLFIGLLWTIIYLFDTTQPVIMAESRMRLLDEYENAPRGPIVPLHMGYVPGRANKRRSPDSPETELSALAGTSRTSKTGMVFLYRLNCQTGTALSFFASFFFF